MGSRFRGGVAAILIGGAIVGGIITQSGGGGGAQSCPAFPSFPDASCTGVPSGTSLTTYSGPSTITTNDTVIDSKDVHGCLVIQASGVIIKNSYVHFSGDCGPALILSDDAGGATPDVTIQDSTLDCGTGWPDATKGSTAIGSAFITVLRADISGCENAGDFNQEIDIQDSYVHDLMQCTAAECGGGDGSHTDGFQMACGHYVPGSGTHTICGTSLLNYLPGAFNVLIKHNTIFSLKIGASTPEPDESFYTTSAIIGNVGGASGDTNVTVTQNLLAGGGFTMQCDKGGLSGNNYSVTDNHFTTRFISTVGFFGPSAECADETGPVTGNVYDDGPNAGDPVPMD